MKYGGRERRLGKERKKATYLRGDRITEKKLNVWLGKKRRWPPSKMSRHSEEDFLPKPTLSHWAVSLVS